MFSRTHQFLKHSKNLINCSKKGFHSSRISLFEEAVIVSAVRTPIGSFGGKLSSLSAPKLGSIAIKEALERANVSPQSVQEVYFGNVVSAGIGQAPARQAAIGAGLPTSTVCTTVNKVCASGLKTVMLGASSIMLKQQDIIIAGGMESMSNVPFYLPKARFGYRLGNGELIDGIIKDGLWDVYNDFHMGMCAERCAEKYSITKEDQDKHAIESYTRAANAYKKSAFKEEIVPISIPQRKGDPLLVEEDEEYKNIKLDKVSSLKPAFKKNGGTVTAANSSSLNDGAAALLLMSASKAKELGLKPLAKILGFGDAELDPVDFTIAPSKAIPIALKNAGVSQKDVDFYEINEAFSVVSLINNQLLGLDPQKVNPNGGAVALGHPIGCSGARIVVSLIHVLKAEKGEIGVAAICNGGGGASALVIQKL